jgi:2-oxoisovalerate dehydrogenase E2 component (dihydrolipoyl transacylase)
VTTEIKMPQLGESVTEGTISKWLVKPGDKVNKYDPIAEVMTDKVNAEIPSSYTGTIKELMVGEDETIGVGGVICTIAVDGEEKLESPSNKHHTNLANPSDDGILYSSEKKRYSPAVLRLAGQNNIDLSLVQGTGRGGRITRKDLLTMIERGGSIPKVGEIQLQLKEEPDNTITPPSPTEEKPQISTKQPVVTSVGDIEIPLSGVRKAIATNMVKSKHEAPHAWTMVEVDVTNLVNYRNSIKDSFKTKEGLNLTFLPFFIKTVVEALKEFPQINSLWAGDKIIQKKDINISIAVATEDALYVPVIKHADEKSIKGLAREIDDLTRKVRSKSITSSDMQGGTFTVNNTGSFGSILSAPIINSPQAVLDSDAIAIRHMVNLCLSLDHRILDGLVCGRFLSSVKEKLETISKDNMQIY